MKKVSLSNTSNKKTPYRNETHLHVISIAFGGLELGRTLRLGSGSTAVVSDFDQLIVVDAGQSSIIKNVAVRKAIASWRQLATVGCCRCPILPDAESAGREARTLEIVRPPETEPIHEPFTSGAYLKTHGTARWNRLIKDCAYRSVERTQEEFQKWTALDLKIKKKNNSYGK